MYIFSDLVIFISFTVTFWVKLIKKYIIIELMLKLCYNGGKYMFLHQIILNGTFDINGFQPKYFIVKEGECYLISYLKYVEYWKYGLEKYVCKVKNYLFDKELLYDKHREKWFIITDTIIDEEDILLKN